MSSGNRLLRDIVQAAGIVTWVDTSHGTTDLQLAGDTKVLVVTRDAVATIHSWEAGWAGHPDAVDPRDSIMDIPIRYPTAMRVSYEDLCANPDRVIADIAAHLQVSPWECPLVLIDQNDKWLSGKGGRQLGDGAPFNAGSP